MTDTYTDAPGHSLTSRYKISLEFTGCLRTTHRFLETSWQWSIYQAEWDGDNTYPCSFLVNPEMHIAWSILILVSVDVMEIITKLADKREGDPKKLATFIFETKREELVHYIPEEFRVSTIYPMEMLSLCWILRQITCRITDLRWGFSLSLTYTLSSYRCIMDNV